MLDASSKETICACACARACACTCLLGEYTPRLIVERELIKVSVMPFDEIRYDEYEVNPSRNNVFAKAIKRET